MVCATPRCGGYLLLEALEQTGLAGKPGEYFWDDKAWIEKLGAKDYTDFLDKVIETSITPNGVFGTKIMWGYFEDFIGKVRQTDRFNGRTLTPPEILNELFPNMHYVFVTRRDKVRQAVSYWKGLQTLVWWDRKGTSQPQPTKEPVYDFEAIDYFVQELVFHEAAWQTYFTHYGLMSFSVMYEDFVPTYEATALRILEWLAIAFPPDLEFGPRRLQKQADELSEDWVKRFRAEKQLKVEDRNRHSPFNLVSWTCADPT